MDMLTEKLAGRLVNKLFDRVLDAVPLDDASLDDTTLDKPGAVAVPSAMSRVLPMNPMGQSHQVAGKSNMGLSPTQMHDRAILAKAQTRNFIRNPMKCMAGSTLNKQKIF